MTKINFLLLFSSLAFSPLAMGTNPQGSVIETCTSGEGEAQIKITIHKEIKKGAKKTIDLTHGSTFSRAAMPIVPNGAAPPPGKGYSSYNAADDKCILNMSYGSQMQGSMNYEDEGVLFHTNELKCKSL